MKNFLSALIMLVLINVTCSAATIEIAHFNGNENLIYPVVRVEDKAVERKINETIIVEVYQSVYEFDGTYTQFDIGSNEAGNTVILSIIMTVSQYNKGAAHPLYYRRALNFNTSSGELMDISYLTEVGEGFRTGELTQRLNEKLQAKAERENLFLFPEALPLRELPKEFYWDENLHVHFIFQNYDVAPYAAGIIDVDIDE